MALTRQEQMYMGIGAVALLVLFASKNGGGSRDQDVEMEELPFAGGSRPQPTLRRKTETGDSNIYSTRCCWDPISRPRES